MRGAARASGVTVGLAALLKATGKTDKHRSGEAAGDPTEDDEFRVEDRRHWAHGEDGGGGMTRWIALLGCLACFGACSDDSTVGFAFDPALADSFMPQPWTWREVPAGVDDTGIQNGASYFCTYP